MSPPWLLLFRAAAAAAKSPQLCPTLCDPIDSSPPGSPVPGILQARTLEWVAISFSNTWKWKVKMKSLSRVQLFATPWTVVYQAPPSMGLSRQEYWSGVSTRAECFTKKIFLLILPKSMLTYFFGSHAIQVRKKLSSFSSLQNYSCVHTCGCI